MTGDLGSDAGRARARPSFLPPVDGYPPAGEDPAEAVPAPLPAPPARGLAWIIAMIVAAGALLVSAFMPWARAQVVVELFGQPIGRDLGSVAGIDADDMVLAVPVLAVVAIALAFGDLAGRDARIGGLAAIPGTLTLLVCGLFVLRLGDVRDNLPRTGLDVGYQITVRYGWYLAVIASLLVVGFSLARPIGERVSKPRSRPDQYYPQYADQQNYASQQYYEGQQYYTYTGQQDQADPYAAWPQEDQAWGRHEPEQQESGANDQDAPKADEPKAETGESKTDQS
ncbi:hypothetical protein E1287_22240 [Actinomadura sp. KC06]|uniref:hypothetical protein n=1 Tax=Actinomadura sp. KC06 TaxID=2530369 RepID=UPI00104CDA0C|nr:hypothetical protein [Actinomadura sp. KC06]TDD32604.1 hypothetical protein E1287_22240 [Actinomadura sp. KC06]